MIVGIASTHGYTRFSDVVEVELWISWGHDCHASEHTDHGAQYGDAHDKHELADLVCYIEDISVAVRDYTFSNCEVWV